MRLISSALRFTVLLSALTVSITCCGRMASGNNKRSQEAAQALLKKAAEVTDIQTPGGHPFQLVAKTSWTQYGKTTNGQFAMAWQTPESYRREIALPGFIEAALFVGSAVYRTRNVDYMPLAALRPVSLFQVSSAFTHWPTTDLNIDVGEPPRPLAAASNYRCVSAVTEFNRASIRHVACFDQTTGVPLLSQDHLSSGGMATITYESYASVGEKEFPRDIKYEDTNGVHGEFQIVQLDTVSSFPDSTLQRPAQSLEQSWCAEPTVVDPPQRDQALDNWRKWTPGPMVVLDDPLVFVTVNGKGEVQNSVLLDNSSSRDQRTAASRVRRGKFPVEMCGTKAIPYETVIHLMRMQPYE